VSEAKFSFTLSFNLQLVAHSRAFVVSAIFIKIRGYRR